MTDRPRLVSVDEIPAEIRGIEPYTRHIRHVMVFPEGERRVVPEEVRARITDAMGDGAEAVLRPLSQISGFLAATFVFDDMTYEERNALRSLLEASYPEAYAWYDAHMLRLNKVGGAVSVARELADFTNATFKRVLDQPTLLEQADRVASGIQYRWKKLERAIPDWTVEDDHAVKRDMIETHVAPLLQDVFDITVLSLNGFKPIPTTPDGKVSRSMNEILDVRAATLRGAEALKKDREK